MSANRFVLSLGIATLCSGGASTLLPTSDAQAAPWTRDSGLCTHTVETCRIVPNCHGRAGDRSCDPFEICTTWTVLGPC